MSTMNEELLLLHKLNKKIVDCKLCPRLTKYIGEVGKHQTKRFINQVYWAKPVPIMETRIIIIIYYYRYLLDFILFDSLVLQSSSFLPL